MKKSLLAVLLSISFTAYAGDTIDQTMAELVAARDAITNAIVQKGGTVTSGALTNVPNEILSIPSGGGGKFKETVTRQQDPTWTLSASDFSGFTTIGDWAFTGCTGLTSLELASSIESIGDHAFENCGISSLTIPATVSHVGMQAFSSCQNLSSVTISNGLATIADSMFSSCPSLESVSIPSSVTRIDNGAFSYCSMLSTLSIPNTVTSMGSNPFDGDDSLLDTSTITDIKMVDGWVVGRTDEFAGGSYDLSSARGIAQSTFSWCDTLTGVTLPNMVELGISTFEGCTALQSISIPNSVTRIGDSCFTDCSALSSITIGSGVTSIGSMAFQGCSMASISLPNGITEIGDGAFASCASLASINIPTSLTHIPYNMLGGCNLSSVTIPDSVEFIGDYAFQANMNLATIDFGTTRSTIPTLEGIGAFVNLPVSYQILVPSSLLNDWKEADMWSDENVVGHIVAHP